jgi:hypothetical protein
MAPGSSRSNLRRRDAVNGRRIAAKPVGLAAGAAGGAAFKSLWRRADSGREVPEADDAGRSWRVVLLAAALQGAMFAVIHAVLERVTARPEPGPQATSDPATTGGGRR